MFFDNNVFFQFVKDCRDLGIDVPIIPGIKVITSKKQIEILPKMFHTMIPDSLGERVLRCHNREQVIELGVEHAINQSKQLREYGVPCLHFFTMNDLGTFSKVLNALRR